MSNIETLKAQILELQEQLKKMEEEETDYKKLVYPEKDTHYWYILDACVGSSNWDETTTDIIRYNSGNYFATQEEVVLENAWRILNTQILNTIAILNKEDNNWEVDWNNLNQKKWFLCWNMEACELKHDYYYRNRLQANNKYYTTNAREKLLPLYTIEEFKFWITKERA